MGALCSSGVNETEPDATAQSPALPPMDIFCDESITYNCQNNIKRCLSARRIYKILIDLYDNHDPNICDINSICQYISDLGASYDTRQLLNDYIHLMTTHQSDDDFEAIHNYFMDGMTHKCNVIHCNYMSRNQRDRSMDSDVNIQQQLYHSTDLKEINTQQIIDKIHCYWLHSYDLGYRLSISERNALQNTRNVSLDIDHVDDDILLQNCVDDELKQRTQIIISKRKRLIDDTLNEDELQRNCNIYHRLNERNNKFILNTNATAHKNDKDQVVYSFGFPFRYGKFHKQSEWYIAEKYDSFKQEITHSSISRLSLHCFDQWYEKAVDHLASDYCKAIKGYLSKSITVEHVLALMIYCGADTLQQLFTETYRKIGTESDESLRRRHSEYAFWGRILKEAANNFGIEVEKGVHKRFYHGIDETMTFKSTIAHFHGPLSTSSQYDVALLFANQNNGNGLIIELRNLDNGRASYFDCAWLSSYAYESEKFFIGGDDGLIIKNIISPSLSENYLMFVESLNIMQQMMRGALYKNKIKKVIKKCVMRLLHHELHRYEPDKYRLLDNTPKYISDSLHLYCESVNEITIAWRSLQQQKQRQMTKGYRFAATLLVMKEFNESWLDVNILCKLFPHLAKLTVNDISLTHDTLDAIHAYFIQKDKTVDRDEVEEEKGVELRTNRGYLKEIVIYRPTRNVMIGDKKEVNDDNGIDRAIKDYEEKFFKCGWNMGKRAKFELRLSKK